MFGRLRSLLLVGGIGAAMFVLTLLTALPAAASSPFTRTGCPSGNFACLRAHHIFVAHRYAPIYVVPRYVIPAYTPTYVMPQYAMPQYVAPNTMPYAPMPYMSVTYAPGMHRCLPY